MYVFIFKFMLKLVCCSEYDVLKIVILCWLEYMVIKDIINGI